MELTDTEQLLAEVAALKTVVMLAIYEAAKRNNFDLFVERIRREGLDDLKRTKFLGLEAGREQAVLAEAERRFAALFSAA